MSTKGIKFKKGTGTNDQLITTEGSGNLEIKAGTGGQVTLGDDNLKFPDSDGNANEVIQTDGAGNLTFAVPSASGGEANTAANLESGSGVEVGIWESKVNSELRFKSLKQGDNITLTAGDNEITIAASGNGNGSSTLDGLSDTEVTGSESGGEILIHDDSDSWDSKPVSGDIAISKEGVTTIQAGSVENSMLDSNAVTNNKVASNAAIDPSKIATGYPAGNLSGTIANNQLANKTITITAGDGLDGSGTPELGQSVTLSVKTDNSTIERYADAIRVKDSGITNAKLANESVSITAGAALNGGGTATLGGSAISLAVGVDDSTVEVNGSDKLQLKADGIDNTHIDFGTSGNQVNTSQIPQGSNEYYTHAKVLTNKLNDMTVPDGDLDINHYGVKQVSKIELDEGSEPSTPTNGTGAIYAKTDGKVYFKNDSGTVKDLTAGAGAGSGSVTSVNVDGGTTGLTTSGGPVTESGTITVDGTLNIASGGTGEDTAQEAIDALTAVGDSGVSVGEVLTKASDGKAKWEAGGSALTVQESGGTAYGNISTIKFDDDSSGFGVEDKGGGVVEVTLGSHWKELEVEGASNLIPDGEEDLAILKGDNITFSTDTSSATKSLTIGTTGLADAVHNHSGADITSGDITLTGDGTVTARKFKADQGTHENDGYGFAGIGNDYVSLQYDDSYKTLQLYSQDSVQVLLDSEEDSTTASFSVTDFADVVAFTVIENGDATFAGDVTADSYTGSGANLTSLKSDELDNKSVTVAAGSALTGGGSVTLGGSTTLNVAVDGTTIENTNDELNVKSGVFAATIHEHALADLSNVSSATPSNEQALAWQSSTSTWVPKTQEWAETGGAIHPADSSGAQNVFIGGTSSSTADVQLFASGTAIFNKNGSSSQIFQVEGGSDSELIYANAGTNKVSIGAGTNPSEKLEVGGTVKATAFEGDGSALTGVGGGGNLDTKGDLEVFTTEQTNLPVGANGYVLTADSSEASGLKWAASSGSFDPDGAQVFNDSGASVDFQIKGNTEDNLFYADGSADAIGVGTATPETNDSGILHVLGTTHQQGQLKFLSSSGAFAGRIYAYNGNVEFKTGGGAGLLNLDSAEVVVNESAQSGIDFRVESENQTHMLFVDAGTEKIGVKNSSPTTELDVTGTVKATAFTGPLTGNVTGDASGNAGTATKLATARQFTTSGDVIITPTNFDGSGTVSYTHLTLPTNREV